MYYRTVCINIKIGNNLSTKLMDQYKLGYINKYARTVGSI